MKYGVVVSGGGKHEVMLCCSSPALRKPLDRCTELCHIIKNMDILLSF